MCPETTHKEFRELEKGLWAEPWELLMFKVLEEGEAPLRGSRDGLRGKDVAIPTPLCKISPQLFISFLCLLYVFYLAFTSKYYIFSSFILIISHCFAFSSLELCENRYFCLFCSPTITPVLRKMPGTKSVFNKCLPNERRNILAKCTITDTQRLYERCSIVFTAPS